MTAGKRLSLRRLDQRRITGKKWHKLGLEIQSLSGRNESLGKNDVTAVK